MLRKALLICGIISSVLFVVVDIIASNQWAEYTFTGQAFSELTAVEAPTRPFMVAAIGIPYNLLVVVFAVGIWLSAASSPRRRAVRIMAVMMLAHAVSGFIGGTIFPMHSRGVEKTMTFTDTMHVTSTMIEVLSMMLAIGFGAAAFGRRFRIYSVVTIVLLLAGGSISAMFGSAVTANLPTPGLGIIERVNIYGFMLWAIVLAVILLQGPKSSTSIPRSKPNNLRDY